MRVEHFLAELLAEIDLRFLVVGVRLVLHDVEVEMIERAAHFVEPVLGLHQDLVEPVLDRPRFLLLGERAEVSLAAPVAPGAADPGVEDAPVVEIHVVAQRARRDRRASECSLPP